MLVTQHKTGPVPLAEAVVFLRDQPAMPGQQSLGRDNRGYLLEKLPSPIPARAAKRRR
jgi:hypothetical protein